MPTINKIIISGGTGFIGRALSKSLLARSADVVILTRQTKPDDPLPGVEYITFDFDRRPDEQLSKTRLKDSSVFIHLAADINWQTNFSPEDYRSFQSQIINVLQLIPLLGTNLEKVIFGSSIMVYPLVGRGAFVEGRDEDPDNFYGVNKLVFEDAMTWLAKQKGLAFLSARIGQVYGPGMRVNRILPDTIEKAKQGDEITLFGDGSVSTDWIYIDDVIQGLVRMIEHPSSGMFNIGSGQATDNTALAQTCINVLNSSSRIRYLPEKIVPARHQVLDLSKSQNELSYQPDYDFVSGVSAMLSASQGKVQS